MARDMNNIASALSVLGQGLSPSDEQMNAIQRALAFRRGELQETESTPADIKAGDYYLGAGPEVSEDIATKLSDRAIAQRRAVQPVAGINKLPEVAGKTRLQVAQEDANKFLSTVPVKASEGLFLKGEEVANRPRTLNKNLLKRDKDSKLPASQTPAGIYASAVSKADAEIGSEIDAITRQVGEGTIGEDEGKRLKDIVEKGRQDKTTMHWANLFYAVNHRYPSAREAKNQLGNLFDPSQFAQESNTPSEVKPEGNAPKGVKRW